MPYVSSSCVCARAVKALVRLHACLGLFEHWLIKDAMYTPIVCMCESLEGSGETARMLRHVWALTDKRCHKHTHFVHVREQWRLWHDCMHTKSRLSIDWLNMPYVRPFCACARAVKALARRYECSGTSEHWLMKYAVCTPILCICESSEGSGKTAWILSLVWVLAERIRYVRPICACARAVKVLARLHKR